MCAKNTGSLEDLAVVGVDIGKDTFHLVGFDRAGQLVIRKQIKRLALSATFEQLPRCIVGMEACLSAHFVSRTLRGMGFEPRIIPAIYVKPFNKGQKNDYNDAEAIAEAALRPNLRIVSEKDQEAVGPPIPDNVTTNELSAWPCCHSLRCRGLQRLVQRRCTAALDRA